MLGYHWPAHNRSFNITSIRRLYWTQHRRAIGKYDHKPPPVTSIPLSPEEGPSGLPCAVPVVGLEAIRWSRQWNNYTGPSLTNTAPPPHCPRSQHLTYSFGRVTIGQRLVVHDKIAIVYLRDLVHRVCCKQISGFYIGRFCLVAVAAISRRVLVVNNLTMCQILHDLYLLWHP